MLNEKDKIKESKKKSSNKVIAAAKASDIDRDNMKQSLSKKRAQDRLDDEYSDISNRDKDQDDLNRLLSNAANIPGSLSTTVSQSVVASLSTRSISPQPTTILSRLRTKTPA